MADVDLSILGKRSDVYEEFERNVRRDYLKPRAWREGIAALASLWGRKGENAIRLSAAGTVRGCDRSTALLRRGVRETSNSGQTIVGLLKHLASALSGGPYYVRLRRDRLTVRDATRGGYFDDEPLVALTEGKRPMIEAVGAAARAASGTCINPFSHPRVFVGDFLLAEKLVAYAFAVVAGQRLFRVAPIAVIHVTERLEGGLAGIELRALLELLEGAGARKAFIWEGRELTDEELRWRRGPESRQSSVWPGGHYQ